jgi:hypothetical protein
MEPKGAYFTGVWQWDWDNGTIAGHVLLRRGVARNIKCASPRRTPDQCDGQGQPQPLPLRLGCLRLGCVGESLIGNDETDGELCSLLPFTSWYAS